MTEVHAAGDLFAGVVPCIDGRDQPGLTVVAKGTWAIDQGRLRPADTSQRIPVHPAPVHVADPAASSLWWSGDHAPAGEGTDVVVLGEAVTERPMPQHTATIAIGGATRTLRLWGPRFWDRGLFGWKVTPPQTTNRFPLAWEYAVGGRDHKGRACPHNPVGRGWAVPVNGAALPSIDDPAHPYGSPGDRPMPINTGFVAPHWQPRMALAGTYDAAWQSRRAPLLPTDFDPRFHRAACGQLALATHLPPGAPLSLTGFTPSGRETLVLPGGWPRAVVRLRGVDQQVALALDALAILPADGLAVLTWKATITGDLLDCPAIWVRWSGPQS